MSDYHQPVLLQEALQGLAIEPNGIYVDVTFGGGGHSRAILDMLGKNGKLFAFDVDAEAHANQIEDERFTLIKSNFRNVKAFLKLHGVKQVHGLLADLGVSSHQFDAADRGFSIRFEGPLDMRMGASISQNAADVINTYSVEALKRMFWQYGELKSSGKLALAIEKQRAIAPFKSTEELKQLCLEVKPGFEKEHQYLARVFQALRIEVNSEMDALKELLKQLPEVLMEGGRAVFISYHSLEDRLVKNFFKSGSLDGKEEKDFFGNLIRPLKPLHNKVILPTNEEIELNNRARSAKMRIAEKQHEQTK